MFQIPPPPVPTQLIVFADDWGRHPSSSQHLIRQLLPQYPTLWVNTVGTRKPRLNLADLSRGLDVLTSWLDKPFKNQEQELPKGLSIASPFMYPGYRRAWQRRFNAHQVASEVRHAASTDHRRVVVTTLPTTADLVGRLGADRWLYYCVDDYAAWPGTDFVVMDSTEQQLVKRVSDIACVSQTLRERVKQMGADDPALLTHGVDAAFWQTPSLDSTVSKDWPGDDKPIVLFWGLIDARMDEQWSLRLGQTQQVHVVLAGPVKQEMGTRLDVDSIYAGSLSHADLPAHAASAQVLIMPYIDAPVTRAMQPLKLLEYLATMKPVVVRDLPSTRDWADCCDLAGDEETFVNLVLKRIETGTPPEQLEARKRRLESESWSAKAAQLAELINAGA